MRERWLQLAGRLGMTNADAWYTRLAEHYAEPIRTYHNLDHIRECLCVLDEHRALASVPDVCELAIWLHDVIYDPLAKDNEARSAEFAAELCANSSRIAHLAGTLSEIILATRHLPARLSGDAALVTDVDMSILAADPDRYARYGRQIRSEYPSITDAQFNAGRVAFLRGMLARARLYHTDEFHMRCDAGARANLAREIGTLAE